ncbi:MAG TPA: hypothetical protein VFY39_10520 [Gammaproteobacteria bacterium]|nr:hypothetical protein [Gammaproteobacteria bacterium]
MKLEMRTAALVAVLLGNASMQAAWSQQEAAPVPHKTQVAADRVDLGVTSIKGNSELPKVLYIVPWKSSGPEDAADRLPGNWLDQVLAPVDPDVFKRKLGYYGQLFDSGRGNGANDKK